MILFFILIYFSSFNPIVINGLVVTEVTFLSSSGKNDYVLTGESFSLSCIYLLEAKELVQTIDILKDGVQVYEHNLETNETQVNGLLRDSVDLIKSSPSSIYIKNASIAMHGNYTCKVKSQISCSSQSTDLVVINDACKESDWLIRSDMIHCLERIELECTGMFPKPSPSCGVYEQNSGRFITAEPFTVLRKQSDGSYYLSMSHRYSAQDYRNKKGSYLFRCMLTVIGTKWSRVINSKLFSRSNGCPDPPGIPHGRYSVSSRKACWDTPTEGSIVTYSCSDNFTLSGLRNLICFEGSWRQMVPGQADHPQLEGNNLYPDNDHPEEDNNGNNNDINLTKLQFVPIQETSLPTCNISSISSLAISLIYVVILIQFNGLVNRISD